MKHMNSKLLFLLLLTLSLVACTKREAYLDHPQVIATHPAATFALAQLSPDEYRQYNWQQLRVLEYNDSLFGWIAYATDGKLKNLFIAASEGRPIDIIQNEIISIEQFNGKGVPVLHQRAILQGRMRQMLLADTASISRTAGQNQGVTTNVTPLASTCYSCGTLPPVVIYGKKKYSKPTLYISANTISWATAKEMGYVPIWELGLTGGGVDGFDINQWYQYGGSGGLDLYTNGDNDILDISTLSEYVIWNGIHLFTPDEFPGKSEGFAWRWWEKYDRIFAENLENEIQFQSALIEMVLYYEDNKADFDNVFNDMSFEQWQDYLKVNRTAVVPILPFIMKAVQKYGTDAFADFIVQLFFAYITHDDITIGDALQYVDFDQVVRSGFEGLISGKGWGIKAVKATISGISDMLLKWKKSKDYTIEQATNDFGLGFISALAGDALSQITGKFPPEKIARGLVKKFNISYSKVCGLMGKGLKETNLSFNIPSAYGGKVSAQRVMEGWATNKIVVLGNNMEERVIPFAESLSKHLGIKVQTVKDWPKWHANLTVEENRKWIQELKAEGYTFYDIGLDPRKTTGAATGTPDYNEGPYYSMELDEIFRK